MSVNNGGNFYGVVGQSLTPEYLARQLPMFQQKVPKSTQGQMKFATNSPSNLPSPPLYPGELIQLQEHRTVCIDAFNEPAVGTVYITNYRIIFCGNLISDPDSLDALQGASYSGKSKDSIVLGGDVGSFSSKFKVNRSKNEANFQSFIYPDSEESKDKTRQSKRLKGGLRRTLGSLRRSPKRLIKAEQKTATLPPPSHPPPLLDIARPSHSESVDGLGEKGDSKKNRNALILNYDQDDVSLESESMSSLSEFSSTTGTDDRSIHSPIGEIGGRATTPIDIMEGAGLQDVGFDPRLMPDSGFRGDSSLEATLCASNYQLLDSGINFIEDNGSVSELLEDGMKVNTSAERSGTVSSTSSAKNHGPVSVQLNGKSPGRTLQSNLSRAMSTDSPNFKKTSANVLQRAATVDSPDTHLRTNRTGSSGRRFWENSLVVVESDSDSEMSGPHSIPLSDDLSPHSIPNESSRPSSGVQFVIGDKGQEEERHTVEQKYITSKRDDVTNEPSGYSKIEVLQPRGSSGGVSHTETSTKDTTSSGTTLTVPSSEPMTSSNQPPSNLYANLVFGRGVKGASVPSPSSLVRPDSRTRSKSSSPRVTKKPKPLPRTRLSIKKGRAELNKDCFVSSLPSNFKPVPPPKPITLTVSKDKGKKLLSPPTEESSDVTSSDTTQSSPEHEGNSLKEPARDRRETSPTPVPPPRRKRKSRHSKSLSSQDSVGTPQLSSKSFSETETGVSAVRTKTGTVSHDTHSNGSHDQSSDVVDRSLDQSSDRSLDRGSEVIDGSHDHSSGSLVRSRDCFSEEDNVSFSADPNDTRDQPILRLTSEGSLLRPEDDDYSHLSSRTSLAVNTSRPHSIVSPNDFQNFNFSVDSSSRGGSAYNTLPRNLAITWSPKSQLLARMDGRKSQNPVIPASTRYSLSVSCPLYSVHSVNKLQPAMLKDQGLKLPDGLLVLCRNFHSMKLHIHPHNTYDAEALREILERKILIVKPLHELFAFKYYTAIHHPNPTFIGNRSMTSFFKLPGEMSRLGLLDSKLWRVARLLIDHPDVSPTYPPHLIMPICTPDMDIIRGASLYKEGRFPTLTWVHKNGATLLRSAATKDERGQGTSNQQMDEALLQAICGCNSSSKGPATLHVFTEKGTSDNKHSSLKPDQVRTYYYHNCNFVYSESPPTFKSVRHSFNKLQALLENKLPDEDYLLACDSTRWLQRVGEILSTTNSVCHALCKEGAHVLVCFESGWDRTTQVTSLAQLLADPFYRTMDGFQILIQKEWVWFGHPFRIRHSRQRKARAKDDGPIFLQWVDCVWQVMRQCPSAFEFNERFLMSLVEESYSGKFGTFMTNCENERKQTFAEKGYQHKSVSTHTVSYWTWVAMVNSAGRTFFSDIYDPSVHPSLIKPSSSVPCMRLWTAHYSRYKSQENHHLTNPLQRQLEELIHTYKKLEAYRADLQPLTPSTPTCDSSGVPPPLMPRDEILLSMERPNHNGHSSHQMSRSKPIPPPKPVAAKHQFDSLERHLLSEGLDPSLCKHVELTQRICQGSLYKIGAKRKNWLQRWFVLDFDCQYLAYFESRTTYENREAPKGVIRLSDIIKVYQNVKKREHLVKNIITIETSRRTYLIQAPSIITMDIWQTCLRVPTDSVSVGSG